MSAMTSALIVTLVGALVSAANLVGPPSLPPESAPVEEAPSEAREAPPVDDPNATGETGEGQSSEEPGQEAPPPPVRSTLPPGLQPVPFPLENQRRAPPPTSEEGGTAPAPERRSIVDLRDPFNRPPPRPRGDGPRDATARLLMPDLKDPFAPGVRRVRSKTLDLRVPNDIRDPFRSRPAPDGPPACVKTTEDGTVVQAPGKNKKAKGECQPSRLDLRDPFDRDPNR